ncbi:MAG: O-antigen ligase family protein, partial [Hyphomicrobiaceae bacterium]
AFDALLAISSSILVAAVALGGGTSSGFLSDFILDLFSVFALVFLAHRMIAGIGRAPSRSAYCLLLVVAALLLVQLVPLPPWLWETLPGRTVVVDALGLIGHSSTWMPITVSPTATWIGVLSCLPAFVVFWGTSELDRRGRRRLSLIFIALGVVSIFLGLLQVAQGPASALRFFSFTNPNDAVGFFANRNHFAALLYAVFLVAAVWAIQSSSR